MSKDKDEDIRPEKDEEEKETIVFDFNEERVKRGKEPVARRRFTPGFSVCPK